MNLPITGSHEDGSRHDQESLFSIWDRNNSTYQGALGLGQYFFDRSSVSDSSAFSLKSMGLNHRQPSQKDSNAMRIINNTDTISLTDMLRTNCSQRDISSSIAQIDSLNKLTSEERQLERERFNLIDDGLDQVSNRRLQNRVNAKRARERKKHEHSQMKQLISELENQNKTLRQYIHKCGLGNKSSFPHKSWRFCQKCQRQIFSIKTQNVSTQEIEKSSNNVFGDQQKDKFSQKYFKLYDKVRIKKSRNQNEEGEIRQMSKQAFDQTKGNKQQMEVQFQQINFQEKHRNINPQMKQNYKIRQRWIGKIWIALSVIMLVIGLQLHGLSGDSQKSIRINQKQAKKWYSELKNPEVDSLKIRMKTKLPIQFIENQKQKEMKKQKEKARFLKASLKKQTRNHQNTEYMESEGENSESSKWDNPYSFEPEEVYTRELLDEEEAELEIDKDLLFSIHAEIEDIGQYI